MRIAIIGAGAIGGYLANRLQHAGHTVTVIARPECIERLARHGIRVRSSHAATTASVCVTDRLSETPDLLLLTVKTQDLAEACVAVEPVAKNVTAVTLQNGIRADSIATSILGPGTVVGGVAVCAVTCLQPGEVTLEVPGWFIVGQASHEVTGRVRTVATTLGQVVPTFITPNLRGARWSKLIGNLTNGLSAATGLSLAQLARDPMGRHVAIALMREGHQVARAAGVDFDRRLYGFEPLRGQLSLLTFLQPLVATLLPILPESFSATLLSLVSRTSLGTMPFRGSTWQSLVRGRRTEIDYLNGEIVRLGVEFDVATPYNARVVEAVHAAERTLYSASIRELWPSTV